MSTGKRWAKPDEPCSVEGCEEPRRFLNGFCHTHHARWKRNGTTERLSLARPSKANVPRDPFFENVEALRLSRGWTVIETTRQAGLSQGSSPFYRKGDPSLETLRALGAVFNVDYWRLLIPGEFKSSQVNPKEST